MSLKKKIKKELEDFNVEICIDNTEYEKVYYIYMFKDKNKLNGFNFRYNNNYNFKSNMFTLTMLCIIFFKLRLYKCKSREGIRFLTLEQHKECKMICNYGNFVKRYKMRNYKNITYVKDKIQDIIKNEYFE